MLDVNDRSQIARVVNNWKLTPATFGHKISRGAWIPSPHLLYISSIVARQIARGNARIIISMPPRHGKSELISVNTSAWTLENFPKKRVILTGYGADLAIEFGRKVRDIFGNADNFSLLKTRLSSDSQKVAHWHTMERGFMSSVGLGGPITGYGADLLLIDDYIKEIKEALSPTYRDYVYNWFRSTAYTRLEPGGSVIIIATRWHSDDLIGRILRDFPGQWTNIVLPGIAEEGDLIGRPVGTALFPERYPLWKLEETRGILGNTYFEALYQQHPVDETAKLADSSWFGTPIDIIPAHLPRMRYWDFAATDEGGDYTVGAKGAWDVETQTFYIEDIIRRQFSPGKVEDLVEATAQADGHKVKIRIEQEPGSAGKAVTNHYVTKVLSGFNVEGMPTSGQKGKLVRAQPFLAHSEGGKVRVKKAGWNAEFFGEFDNYPNSGLNDDQVDAVSGLFTALTGRRAFSATWGRRADKPQGANNERVKDNGDNKRNSRAIRQASFGMARNTSSKITTPTTGYSRGGTWGRK